MTLSAGLKVPLFDALRLDAVRASHHFIQVSSRCYMDPRTLRHCGVAAPLAIVSVFAVSQTLSAAVPEAQSNLKCDAMPQDDGSLMLQLSGISHFPPDCYSSSWADENGHVFARNDGFLKELVKSLTNVSITFKKCQNYTYYRHECTDMLEAHCYANCSFLIEDMQQANVTKICFSESWCMEKWGFTVSVIAFLVVGVGVMLVIYKLWKCYKIRQMSPRAHYTSPDNVEMQIVKQERKEEIV